LVPLQATSALDTTTEQLVFSSLNQLMLTSKTTVIVVAHHLSTLAASDRVIVLDEGRTAEEGTFAVLSQQKGILNQLVHAGSVHKITEHVGSKTNPRQKQRQPGSTPTSL
jgi:ABC-type multidrug transport system fused ATPase/permease subunit